MNPQTFILIGSSGCGKGTQAGFLEDYIKKEDKNNRSFFYLATGDRFREFIKEDNLTSKLSAEIYSRRERQPDFLAVWLMADMMVRQFSGQEHMVVDGIPRTVVQAETLNSALTLYNRKANVIYLKVSKDWSRKHLLSRSRADDSPEGIETRLKWFETDVMPAIEYYRNNPNYNFIEINGEQGKEDVHQEIVSKLILSK